MRIKMLIVSFLILTLTVSQSTTPTCHYSCQSCAGSSYTLCLTCANGNNITVVQSPTISRPQYVNSNSESGICIEPLSPKVNAWGIVIVLVCTAIIIGIHTPQSLYLYSALQTLALISFVEIAWLNPVGYLLQALQFFMIFNWIQSPYKMQDQSMRERQYYRLDLYFHQSYFISNFAIIGIFVLIVFALCVGLAIWKYRKDKKYQQNIMLENSSSNKSENREQDKQQKHMQQQVQQSQLSQRYQSSPKHQQSIFQKILQIILKVCLALFYFTIQQCSLIIMVGLRFQRPLLMSTKAIPLIYCIMLLTFMVYTFVYQLWFFPNKQSQFFNIWRKIGLPVLAIVPYSITYLIVVFMLIFIIFQSFFDYKGGKTKLFSRLTFYKLVQLINIVFAGAYILTQLNRNIQLQTNIIRVFYAIVILAFVACLVIVEFVFGFYYTYLKSYHGVDNDNIPQNSVESRNGDNSNSKDGHNKLNNTEQTINQIHNNIFTQHDDNKNVVIYDLENEDNQKNNYQIEQQHRQNLSDTRKKIITTQNFDNGDKNLNINTSQTRKNLNSSDNGKNDNNINSNQQQNKDEVKVKNQNTENDGNMKNKNKDNSNDNNNDQNKSKHNNLSNEESEQQKKIRKKKQQEEEEAEERARKKRKYVSQMDPQLRKRYGF